jgi:hypothetical protein
MHVKIFVQAPRLTEASEERINAIEPSRRPGASPYFRATIRLEEQGLAHLDRERPFSRFGQQDPVNRFSNAHAATAICHTSGRRTSC